MQYRPTKKSWLGAITAIAFASAIIACLLLPDSARTQNAQQPPAKKDEKKDPKDKEIPSLDASQVKNPPADKIKSLEAALRRHLNTFYRSPIFLMQNNTYMYPENVIYGTTFSGEDTKINDMVDEIMYSEWDRGRFTSDDQSLVKRQVTHLMAASKGIWTLANLRQALPRSSTNSAPPAQTSERLKTFANKIDSKYFTLPDRQYNLLLTSLPYSDSDLLKLSTGEMNLALSALEMEFNINEKQCKCAEPTATGKDVDALDENRLRLRKQQEWLTEIVTNISTLSKLIDDYVYMYLEEEIKKQKAEQTFSSALKQYKRARLQNSAALSAQGQGIEDSAGVLKLATMQLGNSKFLQSVFQGKIADAMQKLSAWKSAFYMENSVRNDEGFTWLGFALAYDELDFARAMISVAGRNGILSEELKSAVGDGDAARTETLINIGAEPVSAAYQWSALGLQTALGHIPGSRNSLLREKATLQVPWAADGDTPGEKLQRIERQLTRITDFKRGIKDLGEYDDARLKWVACRLNCLKNAGPRNLSMTKGGR